MFTKFTNAIKQSTIILAIAVIGSHFSGTFSKVHAQTRLRGTMVGTEVTVEDLNALGAMNANVIRWQLNWSGAANKADANQYRDWIQNALGVLDSRLETCARNNIRVVLDLHEAPGGVYTKEGEPLKGQHRVFHEPWARALFLETWQHITERYRRDRTIIAFDLLNEPRCPNGQSLSLIHI